ncbi:hypothetical protein XENOCAPTIV_026207, partial [Xenoophorus captivus]
AWRKLRDVLRSWKQFGRLGKERQRFQLFNSSLSGESDLLFRDATDKLVVLPDDMDVSQDSVVRWCCISHAEQMKCERWALSIKSDPLVCVKAVSMRDCIEKIKVGHPNHTVWRLLTQSGMQSTVFWKGCLPGSQGNLCKVCMGGTGKAATKRCTNNHNERYYGNMGALRYMGVLV